MFIFHYFEENYFEIRMLNINTAATPILYSICTTVTPDRALGSFFPVGKKKNKYTFSHAWLRT